MKCLTAELGQWKKRKPESKTLRFVYCTQINAVLN